MKQARYFQTDLCAGYVVRIENLTKSEQELNKRYFPIISHEITKKTADELVVRFNQEIVTIDELLESSVEENGGFGGFEAMLNDCFSGVETMIEFYRE